MTDLVKLYNPANAASLTKEQLDGMQKLTSAEIKELAKVYPNMTMQRAYLIIIDSSKPADKQIGTLSTFENLWNLREKNGLRKYVAFAFKGNYKTNTHSNLKAKKTEILDLSDTELMSLPGFKTANSEIAAKDVNVTKVKKAEKIPDWFYMLFDDLYIKYSSFLGDNIAHSSEIVEQHLNEAESIYHKIAGKTNNDDKLKELVDHDITLFVKSQFEKTIILEPVKPEVIEISAKKKMGRPKKQIV